MQHHIHFGLGNLLSCRKENGKKQEEKLRFGNMIFGCHKAIVKQTRLAD